MGGFEFFIKLPPELRLHIWRHALPSGDDFPPKDTQTLYTYRTGSWYLERQREMVNLSWRLLKAQAHIPLLFVNYEARSVALAWLRDQDIRLHERGDRGSKEAAVPAFIPRYNEKHDVIYLGKNLLDDFGKEPYDLLDTLDLSDRQDLTNALKWKKFNRLSKTTFKSFAVSEDLFLENAPGLAKLFSLFSWPFSRFSWPTILYVIVNAPTTPETDPVQEYCLWKLEVLDYSQRRPLVWSLLHSMFETWESEYMIDEDKYHQLEIASQHLMKDLCCQHVRRFCIQPALAIRR